MKKYIATIILLFSLFFLNAQNKNYKNHWKKVENFELKDLPKSSLKEVEIIYNKAKKEQNSNQIIKSLFYKSKFSLELEENARLKIINEFKKEIQQSKFPIKNILESILADLYWQYFQQNRYKIYSRTKTDQKVDSLDFRTWDLFTLFKETHKFYQNSLKNSEKLQEIKINKYAEILINEENSKIYRPTLFDFLAFRSLYFYESNERDIQNPTYKFIIDNESLLRDIHTFLEAQFDTKDSLSQQLNAIFLYKELTSFHLKDKDPTALLNITIERLNFIKNNAVFENKEDIFLTTLKNLKNQYNSYPASAYISFQIALIYDTKAKEYNPQSESPKNQFIRKKAIDICEEAIHKFPKSKGAKACESLIRKIKKENLDITVEKYISTNKSTRLLISYRNLSYLNFNIYKINQAQRNIFNSFTSDSARVSYLQDLKIDKYWHSPLINENDFQEHATELLFPALNQGSYLIVAFKSESLNKDDLYAHQFVQVTDISLVKINDSEKNIFQVVDRNNGKPLQNAKVHINSFNRYSNNNSNLDLTLYSNKNGLVQFSSKENYYGVTFHINYINDSVSFGDYYIYEKNYGYNEYEDVLIAKSFLFTDRSIYRPGQTMFFKGILIQQTKNRSKIVANEEVVVTLYDVNDDEVKELEITTNEFGSFSGEFVLPSTGLTGEFIIEVEEGNKDSKFYDKIDDFEISETYISVEEYKRPKFETKFKPVIESFTLNDSIVVNGETLSFSGTKITNAKVKYRVIRTANIPYRYWKYNSNYYTSESQEISHGETTTDASGNYNIQFKAIPDLKINIELQPVFNYKIHVDVTDINGETHSAETIVRVAYHILEVEIIMANVIDKVTVGNTVTIHTKNLNGEFVATKGKLEIYKLESPSNFLKKRLWKVPDYPGFSKDKFKTLFPYDTYQNENDEKLWAKGEIVYAKSIDTQNNKEILLEDIKNWQSGKYVISFNSTDKLGQKIEKEKRFRVLNSSENDIAKDKLLQITTNKSSYSIGEKAIVNFLSTVKDLYVTVIVEKNHETIDKKIIHLGNESKTITIPVKKGDEGGFAVFYHTTFYNSFENGKIIIKIPYSKNELQIVTKTFKDKVQPGSKQQWSFSIEGEKKDKVNAEILASMYDASLDQFKNHQWDFRPVDKYIYNSNNKTSANYSFGISKLRVRNLIPYYFKYDKLKYDKLNWFGFSFNNSKIIKRKYLNAIVDKYTQPKVSAKYKKTTEKGFVYGVVSDETDKLPGVQILVEGTNISAETNFDGEFKIKAKKGDALRFSFVGMVTMQLKVRKENFYNIRMVSDSNILDEVVITAQGIVRDKKALGYSIREISDNEDIPFMLSGKVAGIQISDKRGGANKIIIRGYSSISSNNNPLVIIDGVPYTGNKDFEINELDLFSLNVLKGEEAIALYGSQAKNGVLVITTKSGQEKIDKELNKVKARTNFKETAFFYPNLTTDKNGNINFNFALPEALTRWKLQLLAHTKDLNTGYKQLSTVSQKDLMVVPNVPRFLRENDTIIISSKISNLTKEKLNGISQLKLFDAISGNDITQKLLNNSEEQNKNFSAISKNSTTVNWKFFIPKNIQAIQYRIVAKSGNFSDGEQNILPVLSNRMLVTETMTMQIKGNQKKNFTLQKLMNNTSTTLSNHKLTLEITSNPVWYAIQAMPYLMEFPYECSEQVFSRYYVNTIASYLIKSHPKIETVFKKWASSDALISNLEKNPELKSIVIQETPWLRDAQSESEKKKRIALLFNLNKMKNEQDKALSKLKQMQRSDGGFSWFSGGKYVNRNITQHIAINFGKLKRIVGDEYKISNNNISNLLKRSISFLDEEVLKDYNTLQKRAKEIGFKKGKDEQAQFLKLNHTGVFPIQYLYMRSFFKDLPIDKKYFEAINYYKEQSYNYWTDYEIYSRALVSLIANRNGNEKISGEIYRSLKEKSTTSEEMGMYWKDNKPAWYWFQSPVQTHATLIEVFDEMGADESTMDDLKLWLIKNKQTNSWKTTKATTNAIYAILSTGNNWIVEDEAVKVTIGDQLIDPKKLENIKIEAGSGYFKTTWNNKEIKSEMAQIILEKSSNGIAFGGLYWQYFENLDKITNSKTGLIISKEIFLKKNTTDGIKLYKIDKNSALNLGDLITVRIEIKSDRKMEFVHLKDMRASGLEPLNTISKYKYQDNLNYYESTKDASTNFFIDVLPKGIFVFEYDLRVNNQGNFSNGITSIQSMYAPEFSSHSKGARIQID
jgi:TonB-dependent SusC/RagA subfamily outer membrane receptor